MHQFENYRFIPMLSYCTGNCMKLGNTQLVRLRMKRHNIDYRSNSTPTKPNEKHH